MSTSNKCESVQNGQQHSEHGACGMERYEFFVGKEKFSVVLPHLTGLDILVLAKKCPPQDYALYQHFKDGKKIRIEPNQVVDLREPGIEKFRTLPLDQTEGAK